MLLPFLPLWGHFPLSAWLQPQQLVLWALMLLSLLQPWSLFIPVALTGILFPCSSSGQILLIIEVSVNTSPLLWPFQPPSLKQSLKPSPKVSTIHFPIFLSYLFPAILSFDILLFLFYLLAYSFSTLTYLLYENRNFFLAYLVYHVHLQHNLVHSRHCISILWTNEWLSEWISPLSNSQRSTCSYSMKLFLMASPNLNSSYTYYQDWALSYKLNCSISSVNV